MASFLNKINPTPSFPGYSGPYDVGTIDVEIATSDLQDPTSSFNPVPTVAFRCFYPCETPTKPTGNPTWIQNPQRSALAAQWRFVGTNPNFARVLSWVPLLS